MYIKITNGVPENYSIGQLRKDNPNVSFPQVISESILSQYDVHTVTVLPRPNIDPNTHYLKQSDFYQVEGKWQVHYSAEPLPELQVSETMRQKRNQLLAESDWIVAVSYEQQVPVPQEWQTYRQLLRDITVQPNFPYEIEWPVKP